MILPEKDLYLETQGVANPWCTLRPETVDDASFKVRLEYSDSHILINIGYIDIDTIVQYASVDTSSIHDFIRDEFWPLSLNNSSDVETIVLALFNTCDLKIDMEIKYPFEVPLVARTVKVLSACRRQCM